MKRSLGLILELFLDYHFTHLKQEKRRRCCRKSISNHHPFSASARDRALHVLYSEPGTHLKKMTWNFCGRKEEALAGEKCKFHFLQAYLPLLKIPPGFLLSVVCRAYTKFYQHDCCIMLHTLFLELCL